MRKGQNYDFYTMGYKHPLTRSTITLQTIIGEIQEEELRKKEEESSEEEAA